MATMNKVTVQPIFKGERFAPITRAMKPGLKEGVVHVQIFEGVYEPSAVEGETFPIVDVAKPVKLRLEDRTIPAIVEKLRAYTAVENGTVPKKEPKPKKEKAPKAAKPAKEPKAPKAAKAKKTKAETDRQDGDGETEKEPVVLMIRLTEPQIAAVATTLGAIIQDEQFSEEEMANCIVENGKLVINENVSEDVLTELRERLQKPGEGVNAGVASNAWDRIAKPLKSVLGRE